MASVNKVTLIGNCGRDPEVRYTPNGAAVCNLTLATTRTWKDKTTGQKQEEVEWHRVTFYDRQAELVGEYVKKGHPLYVEGRLKTRKWQDKDGKDTYTTEIVVQEMQFLKGRDDAAPAPAPQPQRQAAPQQRQQAAPQRQQAAAPRGQSFDDMSDDLDPPF